MNTSLISKSIVKFRKVIVLILFVVCIIVLSSIPIAHVKAEYNQVVYNNMVSTAFLYNEIRKDEGADFLGTKSDHASIALDYKNHMISQNNKWSLRMCNRLNPDLDPEKQLGAVIKNLNEKIEPNAENKQDKAREVVQKAGIDIANFFHMLSKYCGKNVALAVPQDFTVTRKKVNDSFSGSHSKVITFLKSAESRNVDNSELVCRAHRYTIANLFRIRFEYQDYVDWDTILQFRSDMNQMIYSNGLLLEKTSESDHLQIKRLNCYSNSELRRLQILQFIIEGKFHEAEKLLMDAVIEDIKERRESKNESSLNTLNG